MEMAENYDDAKTVEISENISSVTIMDFGGIGLFAQPENHVHPEVLNAPIGVLNAPIGVLDVPIEVPADAPIGVMGVPIVVPAEAQDVEPEGSSCCICCPC